MLTAKQRQAAALIAQGKPVQETAQTLAIGEKRIRLWLRDGEFLQELQHEYSTVETLLYATALRRLGEQLQSDKDTVLQHAVHEAIGQFAECTRQDGEAVVRLESDVALGMPSA